MFMIVFYRNSCVYVHNCNRDSTCMLNVLEAVHVQSVWLQAKARRCPPFLLAFIYRSPSSTLVCFDECVTMMEKVQTVSISMKHFASR